MKIQTFEDLINWTGTLHQTLGECLAHCADENETTLTHWLMTYIADHEARLTKAVEGFRQQADPGALHTMVYDFLEHQPLDPHKACDKAFGQMSFDEICQSVFEFHNQAIELYRYLLSRADIPEARELLEELLAMEEHDTLLLAHQTNRMHDL